MKKMHAYLNNLLFIPSTFIYTKHKVYKSYSLRLAINVQARISPVQSCSAPDPPRLTVRTSTACKLRTESRVRRLARRPRWQSRSIPQTTGAASLRMSLARHPAVLPATAPRLPVANSSLTDCRLSSRRLLTLCRADSRRLTHGRRLLPLK